MGAMVLQPGDKNTIWKSQTVSGTSQTIGATLANRVQEFVFCVVFDGTSTAGQVVIEAAHDPGFAGTWEILGKANWLEANRVHHIAITGVHLALRARITSDVLGGTCDVYAGGI